MRATPSLPNQTGACSTSLVKSHSDTARIETLHTPLPAPPPIKPNKDAHGGEHTSRKPRGAKAENGHVWINLQRQISGGIKASCIHAYLAPSPLSRGSDTCHASNKRSNQPRAATESPRLARERWLIKRCHGDESCSQRGHGHQF